MKRILALAMVFALMAGCTSRPNTPQVTVGAPKDPTPDPEPLEETVQIEYGLHYINMSLELPEGWDYAYVGNGVDDGEIHAEPADTVGIRFWPEGAGEEGERNALALYCYTYGFGVCGTGLRSEEVTFESGLTASMGTYDNGPLWSYISFYDTPGSYVVMNEGAEVWWDEYGGQAMVIINSIRVGERLLSQSEAVAIAEQECTVEYDTVHPNFDTANGEWKIEFYESGAAGGGQTVWIGPDGTVTNIEYDE